MKSLKVFLLSALAGSLFLFFNISALHAGDLLTDSLALVALYDSTDGDNWVLDTGWKTDNVGAWYGIEMENGRVVNIYLQGNNLNGSIPPEIGDLDSLKQLYLNGNNGLTDSLPYEIGNLSKLERLYIYSCNLTGSIPPELGNMASIKQIALDRNSLTGPIPSSFGNLLNLDYLSLHHNNLTDSIPSSFGNLSNLGYLDLRNNNLTGSIPAEIGDMDYLGEVYLSNNSLNGTIPASLGSLPRLTFLEINYNELEGSIPPELCNLPNLETLGLTYNQLSGGIPTYIENLTKLKTLMLSGNPLGGTLPAELGNISGLQHIYMNDCQLTGPIPVEITGLTNLRTLILSNNELTDNLPPQIGDLTSLVTLNLAVNELTGEIPPEIGNMSNLQQLSLETSNFEGTIPPELGNLSNLIYFELYGNELTGTIPPELGNLTNLWSFIISENQLTGPIPPELGNLTNLNYFFVQNNQLSGPVPEELTGITGLRRIHIRNNNLEDLPDFSGLASVEQFYVENNKFTFGDLEPNIHILNIYSPQDSICTSDTLYFAIEDTLTLVTQTDGQYNKYHWTHNGTDISDNGLYSGTDGPALLIMNPAAADAGVYSCRVTNDTVTDLTLYRYPLYLLPSVKVTGLPDGIQCADASISVDYKSAEVSPGNIFTVELSDSLGSFNDPLVIGSASSTAFTGTIEALIPNNISTGYQYRLRVNASNPPMIGVPGAGTLQILNRTLSNPLVTPSGDTGICDGESIELSTDTLPGLQYIWYRNDAVIDGAINYSYMVSEDGTYYVRIFDACSSDSMPSNIVNITVNPLPTVDLTLEGTLLTATEDPDYSYIWYKDGDILPLDGIQHQYTAIENGEYWVVVTDENGCAATSNNQVVSGITGLENILQGLEVFPNPTGGKAYISLNGGISIGRITITSTTGNIVYDMKYTLQCAGQKIGLDVSGQAPGVYIVYIKTSEGPVYLKLVKE
jgi:Leucine-rich repeat (LRR) protein